MITLCSIWNWDYHVKGLALIASLHRHESDFVLYVLTLDDRTRDYFEENSLMGVVPIHLPEIETPDMLVAKANRTTTEYCWTLGSCFALYCMETFNLPSIAYMDSDCYLFGPLTQLYDEVEGFPVAITPHRWTPSQKERLKSAGIYNVGWVYFERDGGLDCLREWRRQCVEWCYWSVMPDGRFADQGYLNDWPAKWQAHEVYNLGVNLAPWNQAEQYQYTISGSGLIVSDGRRADRLSIYHFHGFEGIGKRTGYPLHPMIAEYVYKPYEEQYGAISRRLG